MDPQSSCLYIAAPRISGQFPVWERPRSTYETVICRVNKDIITHKGFLYVTVVSEVNVVLY